jgi:hypothetical protein
MLKIYLLPWLLAFQINFLFAQTPLWQSKGRIVVSSDGNEHDHDDWGATPLSLAIIAAKGLQDKLSVYVYSDHIWGSNHEHSGIAGISPYAQMKESAVQGGKMFGFKKTDFICAVDNPEVAYEALKNQINQSAEDNPLFIVVAGPVQVIGEAISRAEVSKRKFITIVTTSSDWNNSHADKPYLEWENHSGWILDEIEQMEGGLKIVKIENQNPLLKRNWKEYEWLINAPERNHSYYKRDSWKWLFERLCLTTKPEGVDRDYYYAIDASDAGKVIFLLTGIEKTSPQLIYEMMRNPSQK